MSKLPMIARILLGLVFAVFGANKILHFFAPPPMPGPAGDFATAMLASHFFFPLLGVTETLGGLMLLSGRFVALGLALLAGPILGIFAFHAVLAPQGMPVAIVCLAVELYLAYSYRGAFAAGSLAIAGVAGLWFVQRAFDLSLIAG